MLSIDPHKEPKQVKAINSYIVTDLICHDNKISVLLEWNKMDFFF